MPRRKSTFVLAPRALPWYDPRGIAELGTKRSPGLKKALRIARQHELDLFRVHRNACDIVVKDDNDEDCTCIPLIMYVGSVA